MLTDGEGATMTVDEFLYRYGDESGVELVAGEPTPVPPTGARQGQVCATTAYLVGDFIKARKLGRVMSNDTFIRTTVNPDGCRGADVCFVSYEVLPVGQNLPKALVPPLELVIEVRSPANTIAAMVAKAHEYLEAGVRCVVVLDPQTDSGGVFRSDELPQRFHNGDTLTLPDVLPGFAVPVAKFFE
jgi:Uma2 family endonuclease